MRQPLISSVLIALGAAALAAQTAPNPSTQTPGIPGSQQSITLMGCIGPGATPASPFTLSNATRLGPTTVPEPSTVSPPPGTSPTGTPTVTTGTTGVTGATGTGATAGVTAGTTGTMPTGGTSPTTAGTAGTAGVGTPTAGTAPAVMPPSTYQLSGASVSSYVGQSVQVTGMLLPSPNVAATAGAESSGVTRPTGGTSVVGATPSTTSPVVPEFRVVRVEPMGIRCPQ
jgi:hypothetical protein